MEYINTARIGHRALTWLTLVALAGCAPTLVDTVQEYSGKTPLPMPDRVLVYDFAVSANDVKLNSAIGARLANLVAGAKENEEQVKVGRAVAKAFSETLVKELNQLGDGHRLRRRGDRLANQGSGVPRHGGGAVAPPGVRGESGKFQEARHGADGGGGRRGD